jgi:FkbM family methyltransferase
MNFNLRRGLERLPQPTKTLLSRVRNAILRRILHWQRRMSTPGKFSLSLKQTLNFLYPEQLPADLHLDDVALMAAGSLRIHNLQAVRRILAALDGPSAPSPVQVRFGPNDVVKVPANGVTLVLDKADNSVSQDVIDQRGYEPEVTRILELLLTPGTTFVDIGANVGYHTMLGSRLVGPTGRVVAIEPFSENCRAILMSAAQNECTNVLLFPVALDDHQGWSHLAKNIGSNTSLISDGIDQIARGYGTIVPTFRLDQLIAGPIDVIKIDVEGSEARAIEGAKPLIEACRPFIVTEVSDAMLKLTSKVSMRHYLAWFVENRYSVSLLDRDGGEPIEILDLEGLLSSWGDPYRIENLLLTPS